MDLRFHALALVATATVAFANRAVGQNLDVKGSITGEGNAYFYQRVGIGTTNPTYRLTLSLTGVGDGVVLAGNLGLWAAFVANLADGTYNPVALSGDRGIIWGSGTGGGPGGGFVIAPDGGTTGLRIDQNGQVDGACLRDGSVPASKLASAQTSTPPGVVFMFAGLQCPGGSLAADGSAVSRTAYVALFGVIGTIHGVGDDTTTFNLPDLRGQFVRGSVGFPSKSFEHRFVAADYDSIQITSGQGHGLNRSGFPIRFSSTGSLPGGLQPNTTYWSIFMHGTRFKVAASEANAIAGTAINLTSTGSGTHTLIAYADADAATRTRPAPGGSTGDAVGSVQADGVGAARVPVTTSNYVHSAAPVFWSSKSTLAAGFSTSVADSWEGWGANTFSTITPRTESNLNLGAQETRPRNLALLYCIQY